MYRGGGLFEARMKNEEIYINFISNKRISKLLKQLDEDEESKVDVLKNYYILENLLNYLN